MIIALEKQLEVEWTYSYIGGLFPFTFLTYDIQQPS